MGRLGNGLRFLGRWLPWMATGAAAAFRKLPDDSQAEIKEVAKEPRKWGESIERAWDTSKIGAEHFKDTAGILATLLLGRRIDKDERKRARENLAALSLVVPPLRVFMIPGSHVLLGIMARVTPWRLIPDDWIPLDALRTVRRMEDAPNLEKESSMVRRLLRLKR